MNITCTRCDTEKGEEEFSFRDKKKGTRRSWCKSCTKEYDANNFQRPERRQTVRENKERQILRNQAYVWSVLEGASCFDCGFSNPIALEFDHLPEHEKSAEVGNLIRVPASIEAIDIEIAKCEIVCSNCHKIRTDKRANNWRHRMMAL